MRQEVRNVVESAENKDLGGVMEGISEKYMDESGWNKNTLRGILFRQFRMKKSVGVKMGPMGVKIDGEQAEVSFEALILEKESEGIGLPTEIDALHFEVELKNENGQWRITSHRRLQLGEQDL